MAPNGSVTATTTVDGSVTLWELDDAARLRRLGEIRTGRKDAVNAVALSTDPDYLVVGDATGHISLWDTANPSGARRLDDPSTSARRPIIGIARTKSRGEVWVVRSVLDAEVWSADRLATTQSGAVREACRRVGTGLESGELDRYVSSLDVRPTCPSR
jgi:WD40 repeat protein